MTETAWFWTGTTGMALGAVVLFLASKSRTGDEEAHKVVHVLVTLVAACSYLAMAFGQGGSERGGSTLWWARYVDWSVTTPLLLLGLAMSALHGAHRRPALVAALLGADVLMVVTGLFSALSEDPAHRLAWFLVSTGAFLAVLATLLGPLRREAGRRDQHRRDAYRRNTLVLVVLWCVYPVVVGLGPHGLGVVGSTTETGWITVVDLLAKVGYGLLWSRDSSRIAVDDLSGRSAGPRASGRRPRRR